MKRLVILLAAVSVGACSQVDSADVNPDAVKATLSAIPLEQEVTLSDAEWKAIMSPLQFYVMRQDGTEPSDPQANKTDSREGIYLCAACRNPLFDPATKFNSGTGWPSFWQPLREQSILHDAKSSPVFGQEVSCKRCGGHLGHVFKDGPAPTGLRYCINDVALVFREKQNE